MPSKKINTSSRLRDFVVVSDSPQLTIYSEKGEMATIYNPKNDEDLAKLCEAATLEEFIKDDAKKEYPHLLVFESGKYARGVVANEAIKKNQVICEYLGEVDSLDAVTDRDNVSKLLTKQLEKTSKHSSVEFVDMNEAIDSYIKHVSAYAFELKRKSGPDDCMLAHKKRSLAAFINHHTTDPNVHVDVVRKSIKFIASRDIEKGEQLRIDYGPDYEYGDYLYYIPCTENHLRRGKFLADNLQYYHDTPIPLTKAQKRALGSESDFVMVPKFLLRLLNTSKIDKAHKKLTGYEKRLPVIEVSKQSKKPGKKSGHTIFVPEHQQNIMPLLFACAKQNLSVIKHLVEDPSIDLFSKTIQDHDALIVLLNSVKDEDEFITLAKPILQIYAAGVKRIDYLGSDHYQNSVLHLLVERGWEKAVKWFDRKIFFGVVDMKDFDPLMLAIAHGKVEVLKKLFKLNYVKKHLRSLLLIKEDIEGEGEGDVDFVLHRALHETPGEKYHAVCDVILKAVKVNPNIEKVVHSILYQCC